MLNIFMRVISGTQKCAILIGCGLKLLTKVLELNQALTWITTMLFRSEGWNKESIIFFFYKYCQRSNMRCQDPSFGFGFFFMLIKRNTIQSLSESLYSFNS